MTVKALYPTTRPTLDLNFARTRALDPRITYTRASAGTFVDSNGFIQSAAAGQARFEHNPLTGESLGLLVEDARTNLVRYSQDMTDVAWTKSNITVTKETIAGPAGTIGYDKLTLGTFTNSAGQVRMPITLTPGTLCSNSIYVKQGTCRYVFLIQQFNNSGGTGAYFDLQTGTFLTGGGLTASSTTIQTLANGWYRIQLTVTDVGPGGSAGFLLSPMTIPNPVVNASGGREYNGNGEFIYAYGAQIEAGAFPTSYIPTTGATVTRAADVASITGANFSSWYNQAGGTVFAQYAVIPSGPLSQIFAFREGSYAIRHSASTGVQVELDFAVGLAGFGGLGLPKNKFAGRFRAGDYTQTVNGSALFTSTYAGAPNSIVSPTTYLSLGNAAGSESGAVVRINAPIARFTYWPAFLSNAQLLAMTQ